MNKTNKALIGVIIILSAVIIIISIIGIYFYNNFNKRMYYTNLGENINFKIEKEGVFVKTISYPDNIVKGVNYNQNISIFSETLDNSFFVRAKALLNDENVLVSYNSEFWEASQDGYYYLKSPIISEQNIELITSITIPNSKISNQSNINICIVVETLNVAKPVLTIWDTANIIL